MKLILATKDIKNHKDKDGISCIGKKDLIVIDKDTGEQLTGHTGLLWGGKELITELLDEPILTKEHIKGDPDNASYMVIVVRCDNAISL